LYWKYFFLLLLFIFSCKKENENTEIVTSYANTNIESGKNIEINYSDRGLTKVKAQAKTATRYNVEKPYMEFSDGIKVFFYDSENKIISSMIADYATAVEGQGNMIAKGNVVVINEKGEKLHCDELIWDEKSKQIYSNSNVTITTADEIISGKSMVANETFSEYTIKNITGIVKVKSSELE
jgi:LPS export ABC transporter protein LptC